MLWNKHPEDEAKEFFDTRFELLGSTHLEILLTALGTDVSLEGKLMIINENILVSRWSKQGCS